MKGDLMAGRHVLIVEDEAIIAEDLRGSLEQLGYDTAVAHTGEEAIRKAKERCPDILLMDIVLGGERDGIETAHSIRDFCDSPLVYLTAYSDEKTLERAKITEPMGYILKPYEERELRAVLEMALYHHSRLLARMENKLDSSEERFKGLLESAPDGIVVSDHHGNIVMVNSQVEKLFGYTADELIGQSVDMLLPESLRGTHTGHRERYYASPRTRPMGTGTDMRGRRKNGSEFSIDISLSTLKANSGFLVTSIIRDVTERRQIEDALRESESLFRTLAETSSAAIYIYRGTKYLYANPSAEAMTGYTQEELLSMEIWELIHPDQREFVKKLSEARQRGEQVPARYEARLLTKTGEERWVDISAAPILFQGKQAVIVTSFDVTERKQAEVAMRNLVAGTASATGKEFFASFVRHLAASLGVRYSILTETVGDRKDSLRILASCGSDKFLPGVEYAVAGTPCAEVVKEGRVVYYPDHVRQLFSQDMELAEMGAESYLAAPLISQTGATLGHLCIIDDKPLLNAEMARSLISIFAARASAELERKRAEEALRESEERLSLAVDAANIGTWDWDLITGKIVWGGHHHRVFGLAEGQFDGTYEMFERFIHPDDAASLAAAVEQAIKTRTTYEHEYRVVGPDGSVRWAYGKGAAHYDFEGRPVRMIGTVMDITRRKQSETALRRAEEKYRSMIENASYGIFSSTAEGRFTSANPALIRMLGYDSAQDLMAVDIARDVFLNPEERAELIKLFREAGRIEGLEVQWKRRDGSPMTARLSVRIIESEQGEIEGFEGIVEDVTERRFLEEQLRQSQRMEAIGKLAGGVAHDFNNLLTAIVGYSQVTLSSLDKSDPRRQNIEEVYRAGKRAADLTRQLLAFSRKQILQPRDINLNRVIADLEKMLRRLIGEDIEMITRFDPDLGTVKADPGQIEQVIVNLVVNARDAMPEGGMLMIETANVELDEFYARRHISVRPGLYALIAISDTGVGIDEETQSRIFEPFFTTKELGKGTGLGLSTVYGIVKQSGGNIWVYSEKEKGTTFKIYLPVIEQEATLEEREEVETESLRGSETILIVEDDEGVRGLARLVLRDAGYRVLEAGNGLEAIQISQQHEGPIHLMLSDVVMPQMSGSDLARRIARLRPDMKVILMSGYTETAIMNQGIAESEAFLPKPFSPHSLTRKVREVLDAENSLTAGES